MPSPSWTMLTTIRLRRPSAAPNERNRNLPEGTSSAAGAAAGGAPAGGGSTCATAPGGLARTTSAMTNSFAARDSIGSEFDHRHDRRDPAHFNSYTHRHSKPHHVWPRGHASPRGGSTIGRI